MKRNVNTLINKIKNPIINFCVLLIVCVFFVLLPTVGGMRRGGSRVHEPITRYKPCQRVMLWRNDKTPMAYDRLLCAVIYFNSLCIELQIPFHNAFHQYS
jgi:hypothetical protein